MEVAAADASAHAGEQTGFQSVAQTLQSLAQDTGPSSADVGDALGPLHRNQRGDVAQLIHAAGALRRQEVAIGENLEVAIGVLREHVEEVGMHERFAPDNAEKHIPHRSGFTDEAVEHLWTHRLLPGGDIDPAALTAEIAAVDHGNVQKGREELPPAQAQLMPVDRQRSLETHQIQQAQEQSFVGFPQEAAYQAKRGTDGHRMYPAKAWIFLMQSRLWPQS